MTPECPPSSRHDFYFPDGAISPNPVSDRFYQAEYSKYLRAYQAPSLSCGGSVEEAYRLVWIPSNRSAGVIALSQHDNGWDLTAIEFVDPLKLKPRSAVHARTNGRVTNDEAERFIASLQSGGFWTTRPEASTAEGGEPWILEGRTKTGYHAVTRISLRDAPFRNLGLPFFAVARMSPPERTISKDGP